MLFTKLTSCNLNMGIINKLFGKKFEAKNNYKLFCGELPETLNVNVAYNKYGAYCMPVSSQHRTLNQKILKGEVFEPDTIQYIIDNAKEGDIVHAGTFFGDFLPAISRGLSDKGKIWAFEPNPESYRCSQITIILNDIQNVSLFNAGLGDTESRINLITKDKTGVSLGGSSRLGVQDKEVENTELIDILTIDKSVPKDRFISIIQLDVEGFEKQALMGALETIKRYRPILILEDDHGFTKSDWFRDNILSINYKIDRKLHYNRVILPF